MAHRNSLDLDALDFEVDYATDIADLVPGAGDPIDTHDILAIAAVEAKIQVDTTSTDLPEINAPTDDEEDVLVLEDNDVNNELIENECDTKVDKEPRTTTNPQPQPHPEQQPESEPESEPEPKTDTDLEPETDSESEAATKKIKKNYLKAGLSKTLKIQKPKGKYTLSATTVETAICSFNKDLAHDFEISACHHFNFAASGCNREPNSIHGNYLKVKMHICYDCYEIAGAIAFHRRNDPKCTFTPDG